MHRAMFSMITFLAAFGCGSTGPEQVAHDQAEIVQGRVLNGIDCEQSIYRYLCSIERISPAEWPDLESSRRRVGVVVTLRSDRNVEREAFDTAALTVLDIGPKTVKTAVLQASSPEESAEASRVVSNLSLLMKGKEDGVYLSPGLSGYVKSMEMNGFDLQRDANGAWFKNEEKIDRLYWIPGEGKVPGAWMIIQPSGGSAFLSLIPDIAWSERATEDAAAAAAQIPGARNTAEHGDH